MSLQHPSVCQRDLQVVNYLKGLVIDGVHQAASGHPGGAMSSMDFAYLLFSEFLHRDPKDPHYFARDRFVLSAGHESMLLYSLLYASDLLSLEDLKNFRQLGSRTPGHPENHICPGVECTTGPLGQGAGMSVGFAIASQHLTAKLKTSLFATRTWCLLGDGCMQEEVTLGAASYAGHLGLGNLIWFYDKNRAQISGSINRVTCDDEKMIFEGFGWHVIELREGHDHKLLRQAIEQAQEQTQRPTLIIGYTKMACGAASLEGSHKTHGAPLPGEEREATKKLFSIPPEATFYFPTEARQHFQRNFAKWASVAQSRKHQLQQLCSEDPHFKNLYESYFHPDDSKLPALPWCSEKQVATRTCFGKILSHWHPHIPRLIGGSADLEPSNMTEDFANQVKDFQKNHPQGRNLAYGVREFPMACISNGLALYGGLLPFDATFLAFSDYMRPALRLGALQKAQVIHEFTHDSFYVGEDGPTHQPVEQLMSLRLIPDLYVMRPACGRELEALMRVALKKPLPSCVILSRQKIPPLTQLLPDLSEEDLKQARLGGWVVQEGGTAPDYVFYSTGSEVILALEVALELQRLKNCQVKVVSLPCWELFAEQPTAYQKKVLSPEVRCKVSLEAGSTLGWQKFIGTHGLAVGVDDYGASAPGKDLAYKLGFTAPQILERILAYDFPSPS